MKIERIIFCGSLYAAKLHKGTIFHKFLNCILNDSADFYRIAKFALVFCLGEFGSFYCACFSANFDPSIGGVGCRSPPIQTIKRIKFYRLEELIMYNPKEIGMRIKKLRRLAFRILPMRSATRIPSAKKSRRSWAYLPVHTAPDTGVTEYEIPDSLERDVPAAQMLIDCCIIQRYQHPILTFGTLSFRLDADTIFPLVGTYRCISALLFLHAVPPSGKHILPTTKQTAEKPDLFLRGASHMYAGSSFQHRFVSG